MTMIKVQNGIATREAIPDFLQGLAPESLADLSWLDPTMGLSDCAWWPEEWAETVIGGGQKYGDEVLTVDTERKVVVVTRLVVDVSQEEKDAQVAKIRAEINAQLAALTAQLKALE